MLLTEPACPLACPMEIAPTRMAQAAPRSMRKAEFPSFPLEKENSNITNKGLSPVIAN